LSKPREEDNKETFFDSAAHLELIKKYNLKLQQMATSECTNTTRKEYPTWDLVV
jgi:hypothetical protein